MIQTMNNATVERICRVTGIKPDSLTFVKLQSKETAKILHKEACGVCLNNGVCIQLENKSQDSNTFSIISHIFAQYYNHTKLIWHSHHLDEHPGLLTYPDIQVAHRMQLPVFMYHAKTGEVDYFEPNNANPFPLRGTWDNYQALENYTGWQCSQWGWGRTDCFAVVRSYFLGAHDIDIGNFERPDWDGFPHRLWKTPWVAESNGFSVVDDIRTNDVLEMTLSGGIHANHIAVVVDAQRELILHQPGFGYLSRVEKLGSFWRSRIALNEGDRKLRILRHKNFMGGL